MKLARRVCPEAIVIKGDGGTYSKYSKLVTEIVKEKSPLYEKSSIDEFYVDLTGMDTFFNSYQWATELRETIINESGLPISFGMSTSKTVAKIGTGEAKPCGQINIKQGFEKGFLAPLSIRKIPMVGEKTLVILRNMGLEYVKTVQEMPFELMQSVLGANGGLIWKKCNGIDNSPVIRYNEKKSISSERTFQKDTMDIHKLKGYLVGMAENLAFQLRNGTKLTACITVKIRYTDMQTYSKQRKIDYTSSDHSIIETTKELFDQLYDRRVRIRLVGIRCSHLVEGGHQINLFEDSQKLLSLYQAMDKVRNRYGMKAIKRSSTMGTVGYGRMNPFTGEPNMVPAHRSQ
jgi:DNA polymerase-4